MPAVPTPVISVTVGEPVATGALIDVRCDPLRDLPAGVGPVVPAASGGAPWRLGIDTESEAARDLPDPSRRWRSAGAALARALSDHGGRVGGEAPLVQVDLPDGADAAAVEAFVIGLVAGSHSLTVSRKKTPPRVHSVHLTAPVPGSGTSLAEFAAAASRGQVLGSATALARDLAGMPSNIKSPEWLARTTELVLDGVPDVETRIRDAQWLRDRGFGGVIAVGEGSSRPPVLIEARFRPRGSKAFPHLVLVGKGVTFDSGGLSIKPADGMHLMRTDMSGGAAVIAAVRAIAQLGLPLRVTGLVPAAENLISGTAYRPGDVIEHYGGTTSEITNTDAEGRLLLADALAFAVARREPDLLVDVATLTGAMKVALGTRTGALFAVTDDGADIVRRSGAAVGEGWWRLPLLSAHADDVRSDLADVQQAPKGPGAVMAALFLREFVGDTDWIHLDIAGPARADTTYGEVAPVATGFAARTLVEMASRYAAASLGVES